MSWVSIVTLDACVLLVLYGVCCAANLPATVTVEGEEPEPAPADTPAWAVPSAPAWAAGSPRVESAAAIYSRALPEIRTAGTGRHRKVTSQQGR